MRDQASSEPEHEKSAFRQLQIIVVLLIFSNIALGVLGYYYLRAIDRKYSVLIEQTVPTLNDMQTLTAVSVNALRSTNPVLFGETLQSRTQAAQQARDALERDRDLRNRILKRESFSRETAEWVDFQNSGEDFSQAAAEVVGLLEAGQTTDGQQRREQSLRPAFNRYVSATTKAADLLRAQSLRTSDIYTERTGSISKMMLGLGSWPVMIMGIFLMITAVFIIAVLLKVLVFRGEAT